MGANISVVTSLSTPLFLLQMPFYALLGLSMLLDNLLKCTLLFYDAHKWMLFLCLKVGVLPGQLSLGLQATENSRELLWSCNAAILSMLGLLFKFESMKVNSWGLREDSRSLCCVIFHQTYVKYIRMRRCK